MAQSPPAPTVIPAESLLEDFQILKEAYLSLHPGLYRYTDSVGLAGYLEDLERALERDLTLAEAYLAFSRFLARIQCGHTYANFWNQSEAVQQELFRNADKLPFTFRLIDRRMFVTLDGSKNGRLSRGTEVRTINGVPVATMLDSLITLVSADGPNDGQRIAALQISGRGDFEAFDVYFPLLFPPSEGEFALEVVAPESGEIRTLVVDAVTRERRAEALAERFGAASDAYDSLWEFELWDEGAAYLRIGTFVTWKMELDWRAFLEAAFTEVAEGGVSHLVLDLRGNAGGDNAVLNVLLRYLAMEPIELEPQRELLRYDKVPEHLAPYLETWDDSFRDREGAVEPLGDGYYTWRRTRERARTVLPRPRPFQGTAYLLVGPANSSATFTLASVAKRHGLAVLVGRETGGSQRGINGGQFFFLRLPRSGIEMDIPLIGYFPRAERPNRGVLPDVHVEPSPDDVRRGVDTELEAVRALIAQSRTG